MHYLKVDGKMEVDRKTWNFESRRNLQEDHMFSENGAYFPKSES